MLVVCRETYGAECDNIIFHVEIYNVKFKILRAMDLCGLPSWLA